jgi:hypothetical protein
MFKMSETITSIMETSSQYQNLCNRILALDPNLRFVGVINRMGRLVAGGMREGLRSMEDNESSSRLFLQFALRSEMRKDFDKEFGKTIYSFSEREKIKLASFPLQDNSHLLRVSIDKKGKHYEIIEKILKLLVEYGTNGSIGNVY